MALNIPDSTQIENTSLFDQDISKKLLQTFKYVGEVDVSMGEKCQDCFDAIPEDEWLFPSEMKRIFREELDASKEDASYIWKYLKRRYDFERKQVSEALTGTFKYKKVKNDGQ